MWSARSALIRTVFTIVDIHYFKPFLKKFDNLLVMLFVPGRGVSQAIHLFDLSLFVTIHVSHSHDPAGFANCDAKLGPVNGSNWAMEEEKANQ